MLVIISDLHLTDGTSGETIKANAFNIFAKRVRDMAIAASFRQDDIYKPIERIDILLLGDILDIIRSTAWLENGSEVRPWREPPDDAFIKKVKDISDKILEENEESLNHLKKLSKEDGLTLPPSDEAGKEPDYKKDELPVKVKIHYMVGNHDWFYHLPGESYKPLRKSVVEAMGLANNPNVGFPHEPEDSKELKEVLDKYGVIACHGDIHDPFNYEGDRKKSSLGDCIVVGLLNRFPSEVKKWMEEKEYEELPQARRDRLDNGLRELDNVRPLLAIPIWIDALLKKTLDSKHQIKEVERIWDRLVDEFLDLKFVKERDSLLDPLDNVDKLQIALKFSKWISLDTAGGIAAWLNKLIGVSSESYYTHAVDEAFKNRSARYVVYGHTHHHEIVPLDVFSLEDKRQDQIYFNSGTWRRVHRLAKAYPNKQEFIAYNVMTYLAFFKEDERKGRPFACWSGALGEKPE